MKSKIKSIVTLSLIISVLQLLSAAHAITANFMEGQFEPVLDIGNVTSIEAWEQPRTQYTPKNLKSEYQIRYSGTDKNGRGAYSYTTHFTDYDTYITKNGLTEDGRYYVQDNTGKGFITGEKVDLTPVNNKINNVSSQIDSMKGDINNINNRIDNMNSRMKQGFATVTALTSLHPNPRSKDKLEVSLGTGVYMDTMAGAIGLFYHPNDRVQIYAGGAYGGHDSWAGGAGITFSLGRKRK